VSCLNDNLRSIIEREIAEKKAQIMTTGRVIAKYEDMLAKVKSQQEKAKMDLQSLRDELGIDVT